MQTWRGFFTEDEAKLLINCVEDRVIKDHKHSNRDNLKIAVNELLGSHPMRDSIINKIESLTQEEVNEMINAAAGIAREAAYPNTSEGLKHRDEVDEKREQLINTYFNPQK
jgi:hypothetical protein